MALEAEIAIKNDNEEDDIGCYFLQPSTSPYNITEKVQQANIDLFNFSFNSSKSRKVKFKEELISFEQDLTDDDVNSIESDHVAEELSNQEQAFPEKNEYRTVLGKEFNVYEIAEEVEEVFEEEEVIEDDKEVMGNGDVVEVKEIDDPMVNEEDENKDETTKINSETVRVSSRHKSSKRRKHRLSKTVQRPEVHCKDHCIEKVDTHLSMSIRKLEINEKPSIYLPPLQLHQRQCCDEIKLSKSARNLPNYKGTRSEYGLSSRQIRNRDRHTEMIRQKEVARQKLIEEYRTLKMQQNEEVFCQWLNDISKRNKEQCKKNSSGGSYQNQSQKCVSPSVVNIDRLANRNGKVNERPKTAGFNEFVPKTNIKKKKRPHTTQSCVYIEVPQNILQKGIHVGDLLITNSKVLSKKLHILTIS